MTLSHLLPAILTILAIASLGVTAHQIHRWRRGRSSVATALSWGGVEAGLLHDYGWDEIRQARLGVFISAFAFIVCAAFVLLLMWI
jgi:hypothetical protein